MVIIPLHESRISRLELGPYERGRTFTINVLFASVTNALG